jgi:hypothetical protein
MDVSEWELTLWRNVEICLRLAAINARTIALGAFDVHPDKP